MQREELLKITNEQLRAIHGELETMKKITQVEQRIETLNALYNIVKHGDNPQNIDTEGLAQLILYALSIKQSIEMHELLKTIKNKG